MVMTRQDCETLVEYVLDLGRAMMECGAEAWRADNTMSRIFEAYGLEVMGTHTMATQTTATVKTPAGEHYSSSHSVRPDKTGTNLQRLEQLNAAARAICADPPPLKDLPDLREDPAPKHPWLTLTGYVVGAGAYGIYFGGNALDGLASAVIAVLIYFMDRLREKSQQHRLIYTVIACFVSGILARLCTYLPLEVHLDMIMIGDIMLFIPGLVLVNGVRELFYTDILTGLYRMVEALLTAAAIAVGYGAAMLMGGVVLL